MRDAVDAYAYDYAALQGWTYVDRANLRGDYRRAYFTLSFATIVDCDGCPGGRLPWNWDVEARAVRCGPGWYVVSTPLDQRSCWFTPRRMWRPQRIGSGDVRAPTRTLRPERVASIT